MITRESPAGTLNQMVLRAMSTSDNTVVDGAALDITVALAPAVTLVPDRTAGGMAGTPVVYEHTLTNLSNGPETFAR